MEYDPFSFEQNRNPHPLFRSLREESPVYHNDKLGFYALSRYDDIQAARQDTELFSNASGVQLERMYSGDLDRQMLLDMDPPVHTAYRRLVNPHLSPRTVARMADTIGECCDELLESLPTDERVDFLELFGKRLPMRVTCSLLGVDDVLARELQPVFERRERAIGSGDIDLTTIKEAERTIRGVLLDLAHRRRKDPADDLISAIGAAQVALPNEDARPLTDDELENYCLTLFNGGNSTTALLLAWGMIILADRPDIRRDLRENPSVLAPAVNEMVRFEPSSHLQGRVSTRDTELHGQMIPSGSKVLLLTASACRDDRQFDRPDEFDPRRDLSSSPAFGLGPHACIGANLARHQVTAAFARILHRFDDWDIDLDASEMRISSTLRGYRSLFVTMT